MRIIGSGERERWIADLPRDLQASNHGAVRVLHPTIAQVRALRRQEDRGGRMFYDTWDRFSSGVADKAEPSLGRFPNLARRPLTPVHGTAFNSDSGAHGPNNDPTKFTYLYQQQSPIFSVLPPEVRRLIWIELVGKTTVHLGDHIEDTRSWRDWMFSRLCHKGCCINEMSSRKPDNKLCVNTLIRTVPVLPLLTSCRRIYSEVLPLLYACNSFVLSPDVSRFHVNLYWQSSRTDEYLKHHTSFNLDHLPKRYTDTGEDWYLVWRTGREFKWSKALDKLLITVNFDKYQTNKLKEKHEPVDIGGAIQQQQPRFALVFTWSGFIEHGRNSRELHCRIIDLEEEHSGL